MLADSELQRVRLCKSPRTMLITRKSLVVHEFPAWVYCGGVFWVSVPGGLVGCWSVWFLHVSLCGCYISRLRFSDMGHMAEFDEQRLCIKFPVRLVKWELKLLKCWNRLLVIRAWAVAELLSCLYVSRMAELRLLMMIDQAGQARQQPPDKWNRYGRLSTRIVVVLELVMDLVSEFSQNSWTCFGLQRSLCRVLTHDQKDFRVAICQDLKETVINDPTLLLNVITGDESIFYAYDPETKLQSSQWKSPGYPRPKNVYMEKSKLKMMLICFFEQEWIIHRNFVPPGMTVNANFYCDVLRRLHENVRRERPQKWKNQNLIIHHDNSLVHRSIKVSHFWPRTTWQWSPILTRSGPLWLFPLFQAEASDGS